ncbi:MAG TPA: V-type ATPase subunit [Spirochaetota bacterium]|nr:V-type ATPase subunit [Spirochaetota bacterium]
MLTYNPEFVENPDYAYAVARVRALETKLIDGGSLMSLIDAPLDRFEASLAELTGIDRSGPGDPKDPGDHSHTYRLLQQVETRFTGVYRLVLSLLLDDTPKRLISLKYDYELLKLLIKEAKGIELSVPETFSERSRNSYEGLKSMLEEGKVLDLGPGMYESYLWALEKKQISGRQIDFRCDLAYYEELFGLVNLMKNDFIHNFFLREVDANNILSALRLKLRGGKRGDVRGRYLPYGTIDAGYLEQVLDLTLEGFAQRIVFSPLSSVLLRVNRGRPEDEQAEELERLMDEDLMRYLKESIFVTFGIEPVLAYLWMKEVELKDLRTILIAKYAKIAEPEIKRHVRGVHG